MRVELTEAHWLERQQDISLAELAELSGLPESELRELADCGAVLPIEPSVSPPTFSAASITVVKTAVRLRNDFELDMRGVALALSLIERIHELESELQKLRAQLPQTII